MEIEISEDDKIEFEVMTAWREGKITRREATEALLAIGWSQREVIYWLKAWLR